MFSLGMFYGWRAYLYLDFGTTFLEWEGDISTCGRMTNQTSMLFELCSCAPALRP